MFALLQLAALIGCYHYKYTRPEVNLNRGKRAFFLSFLKESLIKTMSNEPLPSYSLFLSPVQLPDQVIKGFMDQTDAQLERDLGNFEAR